MHERFYPLIRRYGYRIAYEGEEPWNNTPIFYNPETVELVDVNYVLYAPSLLEQHRQQILHLGGLP